MTPAADNQSTSSQTFSGFEPLTGNYVFCPNQFFDVCMPNCSRGAIRIVAFLIRQTLGWLDKDGKPVQQDITISYADLVSKAGVSRGAIGPALKEAEAARLIQPRQRGEAKSSGRRGQSAVYSLRWAATGEYIKDAGRFDGFYSGEGHRTPVPNRFFDEIVPNESLAVVKVVGTIIRHTIGYQNQFGGRRQSCPLSYRRIQQFSKLSDRSTLAKSIRHALSVGYVDCVERGEFASDKSQQRTAEYSIRWLRQGKSTANGSKIRPELNRFKKQTSNGSKSPPVDQFKNQTSIRKTITKDISKQQAAAEFQKAETLLKHSGFDSATAQKIASKNGLTVVANQIAWLKARNPENPVAMLRKAIDENWEKPQAMEQKDRRDEKRKRQSDLDAEQSQHDKDIKQLKSIRQQKKQRLLTEWQVASLETRRRWIQIAIKRESSAIIAELIKREDAESEQPRVQVLDSIAIEKGLPRIVQVNCGSKVEAV